MENLPLQIDYQKKIPLSEQIADQLRRIIHSEMIKPGDMLPTVRELAFQLRVNFNTVARAYRILDAEGMIVTWQGRGTFVEQPQRNDSKVIPDDDETAAHLIDRMFEEASVMRIPEETIWRVLLEKQPGNAGRQPVRRLITNRKRSKTSDKKRSLLHVRSGESSRHTRYSTTKRHARYRKLQ